MVPGPASEQDPGSEHQMLCDMSVLIRLSATQPFYLRHRSDDLGVFLNTVVVECVLMAES